jgi:hypothetical protein
MEKLTSIYGRDLRYHSLRIISTIFTVVGALLILIGILLLGFGVSRLLSDATPTPLPGTEPFAVRQVSVGPFSINSWTALFLLWSFAFLFSGLQTVALGTLSRLAIQLEENSRASAQFLDKIRMRLESGGEAVEPLFRS